MRRDTDFDDGYMVENGCVSDEKITIEFEKERGEEWLSLSCNDIMIGVNYATIERMVSRTRKGL